MYEIDPEQKSAAIDSPKRRNYDFRYCRVVYSTAETAMTPETRYAHSGDINIAYQVIGDAPRDLVMVLGWASNIEVLWEEAAISRFITRLTSFARVILFDKRGTGLSDRVANLPGLEVRMDDVRTPANRQRARL